MNFLVTEFHFLTIYHTVIEGNYLLSHQMRMGFPFKSGSCQGFFLATVATVALGILQMIIIISIKNKNI